MTTELHVPSIKTSSRPIIIAGLTLIVILFVMGGAWATFTNLSGAVIATGQVVVLGKPKTVQHLNGGIIADIRVDNGDRVTKGDLLIRLDDTLLEANQNIYGHRLREVVARRARLVAERDGLDDISWDDSVLEVFGTKLSSSSKDGQDRLFQARLSTRNGQVAQLREQIKQLRNQIQGVEALNSSRNTQLGFLDEELEGIRSLNKQGLSPKSQLMGLERQREGIIGQIAEQDSELARIQNSISQAEIQILQVNREFRENVLAELRQIEQEINDVTQQLHATVEQLRRVDIRAPVTGIIHELAIFTIGGVIGPGGQVLQIIPQDEGFEVEANVEPQFVDELFPGQDAILRFSAFNNRTTPEIKTSLKAISPNVSVDDQTGLTFYKINLTISDKQLEELDGQTLVPGMPVEIFIKTGDRTALNYLTKPLIDQIYRTFREK